MNKHMRQAVIRDLILGAGVALGIIGLLFHMDLLTVFGFIIGFIVLE